MSLLPPAPPLLAFANPALFWAGVGLVSVPILIHFFFRRRHRVVRWAAMDFLLAALRKQKRRMEIENLILLLLRCAAILLLAVGLARPAWQAPSLPFVGGARAVVLVMDTSASMGATHTGRTALDRAKERVAQFLAELPDGSKVTLVASRDEAAGRGGPRALLENADHADARAALASVRSGYGPNDLNAVFGLVGQKMKALKGQRLVVFATDLQRRDWFDDADARRDGVYAALRDRADGDTPVPVVLVDAGQEETANVVVSSLSVDAGLQAFAGKLLGVTATVLNYGPAPAQGTLTLQIAPEGDGPWEKVYAEEVVIPPPGLGQPEPLQREFLPRVPAKGDTSARFRAIFTPRADLTDRDRLPADSERLLALRVRPPVRILPVTSVSGALDLVEDVTEVIELLQPIFPADFGSYDLANVDIVLWADPETPSIGPEDAQKLKAFVRRGGGFLAYIGRVGDPLRPLFEGDDPLLPMRVGDVRHDEEHPVQIDREDERAQGHPLFKETRQPLFFSPDVTGWVQVVPFHESSVVARYTNGDPAVLEHAYGRGRVVAVTTTPDERFFRLNGSLLPAILFFNASQYLVWESPRLRNATVGDPIEVPLPPGTREVEVVPPPAAGGSVREPVAEGAPDFQLGDTSTPGFYRIVARGVAAATATALPTESTTDVAVNVDAREGDLRRVTPVELKQAYQGAPLGFAGESEAILPRGTQGDAGEASRAFLGGVVVLLFVELLCAWRFGTRRRAVA